MRHAMTGLVLVAALAVPAAPALAEDSFAGSCKDIQGTATFDTPLTRTVSDNVYHFSGTGTCSGKLNGADITDAPITAQVDGPFNGSCEGSESTAPGPGKIVFTKGTAATDDDVTITFTMTFTGIASQIDFTLAGTKSGTAGGTATFLTQRSPPDLVAKCASGGNSELPFDASSEAGTLTSESAPPAPSTQAPAAAPSTGTGPSSPAPQGGESSTPAPVAAGIDVPRQSWRDVLARGLRVVCRGECALKVRAAKKHRFRGTVASGRGTGEVVARLTKAAKRKLRRQRSVTLTVVATVGGQTFSRVVTLRR